MEISFENKRILVTGGGGGIGRAICKALVDCKATVIALSKTQANLDSLVRECPSIQTLCVSLNDWEATRVAVESVLPINGLVNNAAVLHISTFLDFKPEHIDEMYSVNLRGAWNVSQVVAKAMVEAGNGGTIVQLSSVASHVAFPGGSGYGSLKSALEHMTRCMGVELGPHNVRLAGNTNVKRHSAGEFGTVTRIRSRVEMESVCETTYHSPGEYLVNCVNPTILKTGTVMGDSLTALPGFAEMVISKTPLRKLADFSDVIPAVLFFLSDKSGMTTGETLLVDGGLAAL